MNDNWLEFTTAQANEVATYVAGEDEDPVLGPQIHTNIESRMYLEETDWYVVRKADDGTAIPSAVQTYRDGVRTKATAHETAVSATTTVSDLIAVNIGDGWPTEPS